MKPWNEFSKEEPELAKIGKHLLFQSHEHIGLAFIATLRKDGAPRLHPVSLVFSDGHLYVLIPPTSPKCADLKRDGRYAMQPSPCKKTRETKSSILQVMPYVFKIYQYVSRSSPAQKFTPRRMKCPLNYFLIGQCIPDWKTWKPPMSSPLIESGKQPGNQVEQGKYPAHPKQQYQEIEVLKPEIDLILNIGFGLFLLPNLIHPILNSR